MSEIEPKINPYAPTTEVEPDSPLIGMQQQDPSLPLTRATWKRTALRWFVVCGISAAPSFVFGFMVTNGQAAAMLVGVVIFAMGYTWLDYTTASHPFRQNQRFSRTLRIAYGTRIAISILFPIGLYVDTVCGILSVGLTSFIAGAEPGSLGSMGFAAALFTTLVQGVLLNMLLAIFAGIVHLIQVAVHLVRN